MKILKNVLLFILKVAVIAGMLYFSVLFWLILLFSTPWLLWVILPLNIALIVFFAVLLSRIGTSKNAEKPPLWKRIVHPAAIIASAAAIVTLIVAKDLIKEKLTDITVNLYAWQADELITYENSGNQYIPSLYDSLFDTKIRRDSMLLDYDKMTVTFLYRMDGDHKKRVRLYENSFVPNDDHILQFKNPLRDGGEVKIYYDKNGGGSSLRPSFRTCAVTVEHSGKVYGAHFDPEPMRFESCLEDIYALEEKDLETVAYHENEMPSYAGNVKSDTIFLDPENDKLYIVHAVAPGFDFARVCVDEFDLIKTDKIKNVYIQAEFELKNGNKLYACTSDDYTKYANDPALNWVTKTNDYMALKYDGKLYETEFRINIHEYDFLNSIGAVSSPNVCTSIE